MNSKFRNENFNSKVHLFTWNPENWPHLTDELISATILVLHDGSVVSNQWSVGGRQNGIEVDDSFFLLRQGSDRRGIIAAGKVTSEIFQAPHWDGSNKETTYVKYSLSEMVTVDCRLPIEDLETYFVDNSLDIKWNQIFSSGRTLSDRDAEELCRLWEKHLTTL